MVPNSTKQCKIVPHGAEQHRSVSMGTEQCQAVKNSKGTERCRMLPNSMELCRMVANGAKCFILYHSVLFGFMYHKSNLKVSWMSPKASEMFKNISGIFQNDLECNLVDVTCNFLSILNGTWMYCECPFNVTWMCLKLYSWSWECTRGKNRNYLREGLKKN